MGKKVVDLVRDIVKFDILFNCWYFDIVVVCEDVDGNDFDVLLVFICFR